MYSVSLWDPELFCNIACLNSREHEGNSSGSPKGESTGSTTTGSSTGWGIHPTYVSVAHLNSCREKEQVFCWAYCSTKWITLRFLHAHVSLVRKMIMFCWTFHLSISPWQNDVSPLRKGKDMYLSLSTWAMSISCGQACIIFIVTTLVALTYNHQGEFKSSFDRLAVDLVGKIGKTNVTVYFFRWRRCRMAYCRHIGGSVMVVRSCGRIKSTFLRL